MAKLVIVSKRKRKHRRNSLATAFKPLESKSPSESPMQKRANQRPLKQKLPPMVGAGFDMNDLKAFLDPPKPKRKRKAEAMPKVLDGNGRDLKRSDPQAYRAILKQRGLL